jgi:hypothetical protein
VKDHQSGKKDDIKKKRTPYGKVERWLTKYPSWKTRIETLKAQLEHIPGLAQRLDLVPIYGKGQPNESIPNEIIRRFQIREKELPRLELRVKLIDIACSRLRAEEKELVRLKYFEEVLNPSIMAELNWSPRTFYRRRIEVLDKIYDALGREDAHWWFEGMEVESAAD